MTSTIRNFLLFLVANLAICAVVFLFACDFFSQYDATAISTNDYNVQETKIVRVHLVDDRVSHLCRRANSSAPISRYGDI